MNAPLFGTSGIRGNAEELFTDQFCFDLGRTFANFLNTHKVEGSVAIGMDPRGSSPRIVKSIETGLSHNGRFVYNQGATPVPSMNYILIANTQFAGSIMVSGSHIKPLLNGVKFFFGKEEILKEHEREIESIYQKLKGTVKYVDDGNPHAVFENNAKNDYQEMLLKKAVGHFPNWKVVVDAGDGAQSDVMPYVLDTLGIRVVEINTTIQGEFYARDTEVPKDFEGLIEEVKAENADFGVGYDSDGDRVVFIDGAGNFIPGDFTCATVAKNTPGRTVVTPINSSQVVEHIGKEVIRTKVGSPYVVAAMKKSGATFGYEGNGGGVFSDMHSRDGGRMTIEVMNILAKEGVKLSELISRLPRFFVYKDKVEYKWDLKDKILTEAQKEFKGIKTEKIDGIKIWIDERTWILFRSSMNAPEFRVFAESDDDDRARRLLTSGMDFVKKWISIH